MRQRLGIAAALLGGLFLADAAALLRFVVPYFQGW